MSKVKDNENENSLIDLATECSDTAVAVNKVQTVDMFVYAQLCVRHKTKGAERKATLKLLTGKEWAKQMHEYAEEDKVIITPYTSKEES